MTVPVHGGDLDAPVEHRARAGLEKGIEPLTIIEVFILSLGHTLALSIPMAVLVGTLVYLAVRDSDEAGTPAPATASTQEAHPDSSSLPAEVRRELEQLEAAVAAAPNDLLAFKRIDGVDGALRTISGAFAPGGAQAVVLRDKLEGLDVRLAPRVGGIPAVFEHSCCPLGSC